MPHQWTGPGSTAESFDYDGDGRLTTRLVTGAGTPGSGSGIYDVVARDALGRVLNHSDSPWQWTRTVYGGLGAVVALEQERDGVRTKDEMVVDGLGNQLTLVRNRGLDGEVTTTSTYGSSLQINSRNDTPTTRLDNNNLPATRHIESTSYTQYDMSGNTRQTSTSAQDLQVSPNVAWVPAQSGAAWTESWYDGENRLRAYQRTYFLNGGRRTQLAEYRYDPFGRRVMTRTRVDSLVCPNQQLDVDCQATVERFYWDGDRLVYEERGSGWGGTIATDLETNTGPNSAYYGAVHYLHGTGLDEPLSMRHSRLGPMVLHRNWRGIVTGATQFSGAGENSVVWPGAYRDAFHAPDLRQQPPAQTGWIGSLAEDQRDVTGLTYRRNRYYDANSGRFTQVDPIGMAGGWNIYGFVGGDPINRQDPFGLCSQKDGWSGCRLANSAEGQRIAAAAIAMPEWTYTQGRPGSPLKNPVSFIGDCTDFCQRSAIIAGLEMQYLTTSQFGSSSGVGGRVGGYEEVFAGLAQPGDVFVRGGHAGIVTGLDRKRGLVTVRQNGGGASPYRDGKTGNWIVDDDSGRYFRQLVPDR